MLSRISFYVPMIAYTFASMVATLCLFMAKHHYDARHRFETFLAAPVHVVPPSSKPVPGQESIDIALAMFNIQVPTNAKKPVYDPGIYDRGLTTLRGWSNKMEVSVGPAAFTSWSMLGSTLAHELEVHCQQNFALIRLKDLFGFEGTLHAEREAYSHELANAKRFRLDNQEFANIKATMDFYYPLPMNPDASEASLSARMSQ